MSVFYLVRHGEHNADDVKAHHFIGLGLELSPLTERGREQALQCADDLRFQECECMLVSPYTRALETAAIMETKLSLPLQVEIDLREKDCDLHYSVKNFEELMQSRKNPMNSESDVSIRLRVDNVLSRYTAYQKVIVVTHGDLIYALTGKKTANCEIVEYQI